MRVWHRALLFGLIVVCGESSREASAMDWLPISRDELTMTAEPKAPAAPAIFLYRQVDRHDDGPDESDYLRIKILTEEGRKYADVEIPYEKGSERVDYIVARTIHSDGTIINFDGTVYDKPMVQSNGAKLLAKTFTLPDVQVGSIIEYRYRHYLKYGYVFNSQWILSDELFTKHAKFSLMPYQGYTLSYSWPIGLPDGTPPPSKVHDVIRLESSDVPAFVTEEFMPPVNELTYRVDFIYWSDMEPEKKPADFWKKYDKKKYSEIEHFLDEPRAMKDAVAGIVNPADSAEAKLRKIYARAQQVRNISFEVEKTQQESDRENLKNAKNVEQVWQRGYGDADQITWLFVALARAAGFHAEALLVSSRNKHFFNPSVMNPSDLNTNVALVQLDGADLFLDPGVALAPFGILPWPETAVAALRLDKDGGKWVNTPAPKADESHVDRTAIFELTTAGTLQGKVTVTYTGHEALWRRLEERHEDDTDRKQFLEEQMKSDIPSGIEVELTNHPDWDVAAPTLVAEYQIKVPGWAATAGQRALMPASVFGNAQKHVFEHATRINSLYFNYPYRIVDDVTVKLPASWQVSGIPHSRNDDRGGLVYSSSVDAKDGTLHFKRDISMNAMLLKKAVYPTVQDFFRSIRNGDEDQAVLLRSAKLANQ
jgi:hypothetical protein